MDPARPRSRSHLSVVALVCLLALSVALAWSLYVAREIAQVAQEDQATQADAIAVFGAAEYDGRP